MIRMYRHTIIVIPRDDESGLSDWVRCDFYAGSGKFHLSSMEPCSFHRERSLPVEGVCKAWLVGWLRGLPAGTKTYEGD